MPYCVRTSYVVSHHTLHMLTRAHRVFAIVRWQLACLDLKTRSLAEENRCVFGVLELLNR